MTISTDDYEAKDATIARLRNELEAKMHLVAHLQKQSREMESKILQFSKAAQQPSQNEKEKYMRTVCDNYNQIMSDY